MNPFTSADRAGRHPILRETPAVDFFEGALLGNGALGAVVCTRPDAVMVHFGHNNVWDVRVCEAHKEHVGTFSEIFRRVATISAGWLRADEWFNDYHARMRASSKKPYPRPFPCGTLVLGFDRRRAEVLGHRVDIAEGRCEVRFLVGGTVAAVEIFVEPDADRLWMRGDPRLVFDRIHLLPDPKTPEEFPVFTVPATLPENTLAFRQTLPFAEPGVYDREKGHPKDRAFALTTRVNRLETRTRIATWTSLPEEMGQLERGLAPADAGLILCVGLDEGLAAKPAGEPPPAPDPAAFTAALGKTRTGWREYWSRSGVALDDEFLERIWYWNLYFLNCSVKPGVTCPGLFANWSHGDIGTAWHGDYHMNYNTQQPFWVTFSSNHVDKNLPYVDLVERVLPLQRQWAQDYYDLRGAFGMHTLYPVEMTTNPYAAPDWGWEICETPWQMQGLWWHYLYTRDRDFLERRAFVPIREAVQFLADYLKRPETHGPQWNDDRYHVFPTVSPELYGLQPGFRLNSDCLVDLTLIRFLFRAWLEACEILGCEEAESELLTDVYDILDHFPEYPTVDSPRGRVFVSVPGEHPETVQNTPNSLMTVFPGEEHGLHSPPDQLKLCRNTLRNHRNEGGNELVFLNLQAARLGCLDLEKFKRQIRYCLLPNGTCTDKCLQVDGRYHDTTPFDFMARMGIWFENFALPAVINECLLQGYHGALRFFPNWPSDRAAEFRTLRAVGAFLVSARWEDGAVAWVEILSEAGSPLRVLLPWERARVSRQSGTAVVTGLDWATPTVPGEALRLTRA